MSSERSQARDMLLTGKQLAMKLNVHITTIRRACRNEDIPYERLGKLYFFDFDRVRQAMQRNGGDVLKGGDGLRATGGESRRRAQPIRPRLGKTGASIAQAPRRKK
jgi:excisionase family DNA binding protein